MSHLAELKPELVWKYFYEITQIPRASKKEQKIIQYIIDFAEKQHLNHAKDHAGNIVITKPPAKEAVTFCHSVSRLTLAAIFFATALSFQTVNCILFVV